jgi:Na+/H+-translocating membrane pyrophosphatase
MFLPHHHSITSGPAPDSPLSLQLGITLICVCSVLGLIWAFINYLSIRSIQLESKNKISGISEAQTHLILDIGDKISSGAVEFLKQEYLVCMCFVVLMFVVILGAIERFKTAYTAVAFLVGAVTSVGCGAIGMMIATYTNYRVTY